MESDEDFITKYQILLENEKRRLTVENFITENNELDISEFQTTTECTDPKIVTILRPSIESPEKSTNVVGKQETVSIIQKNTKYENNSNEQRVNSSN